MDWGTLIEVLWKILAVLVLVFLNGFFVATEFALVKVRQTQLEPLIQGGNRRARMVQHLLQHIDAYLSAAQLGITLASLGLGWIGEPIFHRLLQPVFHWFRIESEGIQGSLSFGVGFTVITFLHIVAGEQAPKTYAIRHPLRTALWVAYPVRAFHAVAFPFIWLLNESSLWMLRRLGIGPSSEGEGIQSEEELRLLVGAAQEHAGATKLGRDIVLNALDLRHRVVRDVMRPRKEIVVLDTEASMAECLDVAEKSRYSRFPMCEHGDVDRTRGVVHIKDLYGWRLRARSGRDLLPTARKLIYVPPNARLEKVLQLFLDRRLHLGIVVDEYGGTLGMVTLENILEELVGQIQDEFDQEKPLCVRQDDHTWELDGALPLHELSELVGESLHGEDVTTVSGWMTGRLGGFPKAGDRVAVHGHELQVEELDGRRVARLRLVRLPPAEGAGAEI